VKLPELSADHLSELIDAFNKCQDAQPSDQTLTWAARRLIQEREKRVPPCATQSLSTVSTTPEREGSTDVESLPGSSCDEEGHPQPRVAWVDQSPLTDPKVVAPPPGLHDLSMPWKVVSMRPPPGLEATSPDTYLPGPYAPGMRTFLADGVSLFTL